MTMLPITLTIAGAAALLNVWLGFRVSVLRLKHKVSIGHGGQTPIAIRMRAHANFIEYTPFFLILLALIELAHGPETWLWLVAILYIIGRILHAFGMDRPAPNKLRQVGAILTWAVLVGLAGYAIVTPYFAPAFSDTIQQAAARPAA